MSKPAKLLEEQQRLNDLALQIQNTEQMLEQLRAQRLVQIGRVQLLTEQMGEAQIVNGNGEPEDAMAVLAPDDDLVSDAGTSEP